MGAAGEPPPKGTWNLGRFGLPINIFALCYIIFTMVWLSFPTFKPVNKETMNYAAPIWIGVLTFALADYFFLGGSKRLKLDDEIGRAHKVEDLEPAP